MKEKKNYTVVMGDGSEQGIFVAREPRLAAKKAANKMNQVGESGTICIRQKGTKKIREYAFKIIQIKIDDGPAWLPKKAKTAEIKYVGSRMKED